MGPDLYTLITYNDSHTEKELIDNLEKIKKNIEKDEEFRKGFCTDKVRFLMNKKQYPYSKLICELIEITDETTPEEAHEISMDMLMKYYYEARDLPQKNDVLSYIINYLNKNRSAIAYFHKQHLPPLFKGYVFNAEKPKSSKEIYYNIHKLIDLCRGEELLSYDEIYFETLFELFDTLVQNGRDVEGYVIPKDIVENILNRVKELLGDVIYSGIIFENGYDTNLKKFLKDLDLYITSVEPKDLDIECIHLIALMAEYSLTGFDEGLYEIESAYGDHVLYDEYDLESRVSQYIRPLSSDRETIRIIRELKERIVSISDPSKLSNIKSFVLSEHIIGDLSECGQQDTPEERIQMICKKMEGDEFDERYISIILNMLASSMLKTGDVPALKQAAMSLDMLLKRMIDRNTRATNTIIKAIRLITLAYKRLGHSINVDGIIIDHLNECLGTGHHCYVTPAIEALHAICRVGSFKVDSIAIIAKNIDDLNNVYSRTLASAMMKQTFKTNNLKYHRDRDIIIDLLINLAKDEIAVIQENIFSTMSYIALSRGFEKRDLHKILDLKSNAHSESVCKKYCRTLNHLIESDLYPPKEVDRTTIEYLTSLISEAEHSEAMYWAAKVLSSIGKKSEHIVEDHILLMFEAIHRGDTVYDMDLNKPICQIDVMDDTDYSEVLEAIYNTGSVIAGSTNLPLKKRIRQILRDMLSNYETYIKYSSGMKHRIARATSTMAENDLWTERNFDSDDFSSIEAIIAISNILDKTENTAVSYWFMRSVHAILKSIRKTDQNLAHEGDYRNIDPINRMLNVATNIRSKKFTEGFSDYGVRAQAAVLINYAKEENYFSDSDPNLRGIWDSEGDSTWVVQQMSPDRGHLGVYKNKYENDKVYKSGKYFDEICAIFQENSSSEYDPGDLRFGLKIVYKIYKNLDEYRAEYIAYTGKDDFETKISDLEDSIIRLLDNQLEVYSVYSKLSSNKTPYKDATTIKGQMFDFGIVAEISKSLQMIVKRHNHDKLFDLEKKWNLISMLNTIISNIPDYGVIKHTLRVIEYMGSTGISNEATIMAIMDLIHTDSGPLQDYGTLSASIKALGKIVSGTSTTEPTFLRPFRKRGVANLTTLGKVLGHKYYENDGDTIYWILKIIESLSQEDTVYDHDLINKIGRLLIHPNVMIRKIASGLYGKYNFKTMDEFKECIPEPHTELQCMHLLDSLNNMKRLVEFDLMELPIMAEGYFSKMTDEILQYMYQILPYPIGKITDEKIDGLVDHLRSSTNTNDPMASEYYAMESLLYIFKRHPTAMTSERIDAILTYCSTTVGVLFRDCKDVNDSITKKLEHTQHVRRYGLINCAFRMYRHLIYRSNYATVIVKHDFTQDIINICSTATTIKSKKHSMINSLLSESQDTIFEMIRNKHTWSNLGFNSWNRIWEISTTILEESVGKLRYQAFAMIYMISVLKPMNMEDMKRNLSNIVKIIDNKDMICDAENKTVSSLSFKILREYSKLECVDVNYFDNLHDYSKHYLEQTRNYSEFLSILESQARHLVNNVFYDKGDEALSDLTIGLYYDLKSSIDTSLIVLKNDKNALNDGSLGLYGGHNGYLIRRLKKRRNELGLIDSNLKHGEHMLKEFTEMDISIEDVHKIISTFNNLFIQFEEMNKKNVLLGSSLPNYVTKLIGALKTHCCRYDSLLSLSTLTSSPSIISYSDREYLIQQLVSDFKEENAKQQLELESVCIRNLSEGQQLELDAMDDIIVPLMENKMFLSSAINMLYALEKSSHRNRMDPSGYYKLINYVINNYRTETIYESLPEILCYIDHNIIHSSDKCDTRDFHQLVEMLEKLLNISYQNTLIKGPNIAQPIKKMGEIVEISTSILKQLIGRKMYRGVPAIKMESIIRAYLSDHESPNNAERCYIRIFKLIEITDYGELTSSEFHRGHETLICDHWDQEGREEYDAEHYDALVDACTNLASYRSVTKKTITILTNIAKNKNARDNTRIKALSGLIESTHYSQYHEEVFQLAKSILKAELLMDSGDNREEFEREASLLLNIYSNNKLKYRLRLGREVQLKIDLYSK